MAKTLQSQLDATARYNEKTYKNINLRLRLDEDRDLIKSWETCTKELGLTNREWVRHLAENGLEKER